VHPGDFVPGNEFFAAPGDPFGDAALDLRVGPVRLRLKGLSGPQAEGVGERFHPFVGHAEGNPDLVIGLRRATVGAFLRLRPGRAETYRLDGRIAGSRELLWSYEFAGWMDARNRTAILALVEPAGPLFDRGLENFLRVMTASFVLDHGGFLLHGACVVRRGAAYVFFGPSGSGKTTVARLSPEDTILSDDLTLVMPAADRYVAAGIPFGLAHHAVPASRGSFPIASLNRLIQSRDVGREPLSGARAVAEVAGSLPFVTREAARAGKAIATVGRAVEALPVFRLRFRKDDSFWKVVEEP
jgi:hypothetical protein